MKQNVGGLDRQLRYGAGAILILVALFAPIDPLWRWLAAIVALVALVTAITGL